MQAAAILATIGLSEPVVSLLRIGHFHPCWRPRRVGEYWPEELMASEVVINDQWRICFEWQEGGPTNVEIVDYHD